MSLLPTPSDHELRVALEAGFLLRDVMRYNEAATVFQGVAALRPDLELPVLGLASVLIRQGELSRAQELCESILARSPDSVHAQVQLGEILLYRGAREEGEERLRSVIAGGGDSPHVATAQALLDTLAALTE
ncbi:MAG: tetratricopeptide repeat protein [Acidobacteriota bacterium]